MGRPGERRRLGQRRGDRGQRGGDGGQRGGDQDRVQGDRGQRGGDWGQRCGCAWQGSARRERDRSVGRAVASRRDGVE